MLPYIFASIALYAVDHIIRLIKSRFTLAHIHPLPELDLTRVEIPAINAGWRAGQHVRLRVISFKMGWFGWAEVHPFTIANVAESGPEGMVLMCKRAGGWTRKLYETAKLGVGCGGREVRVVVEGPYGLCSFFPWLIGPQSFSFSVQAALNTPSSPLSPPLYSSPAAVGLHLHSPPSKTLFKRTYKAPPA